MRYIVDLVDKDGQSLDGLIFRAYHDAPVILVKDTATGVVVPVEAIVISRTGVVGFSKHAVASMFSVVKLDCRAVGLHRYIKRWQSSLGTREVQTADADLIIVSNGHVDTSRVYGSDVLALHLVQDTIWFGGESCSVVAWQYGMFGETHLFTLYDALRRLSKTCKRNLFDYRVIQIYSKRQNYTSVVELEHSLDSARYFLKATLDVTGQW